MHNYSITKRAFKMYSGYNPKYFPLKLVQTVFSNISPYFNLWMSAEIVTAMYEGKGGRELFLLAAITLLGNLFVTAVSAFISRTVEAQHEILSNNMAAAFNSKTLSLDYDKLENPDIRKHRRRIIENSWINSYGVQNMEVVIGRFMNVMVNFFFCLILFIEMVSLIVAVGFNLFGFMLIAGLIVCIGITVCLQSRLGKKMAVEVKKAGELMLEANRLGSGYDVPGMDSRIYRSISLMVKIYKKLNKKHLSLISAVNKMHFKALTPTVILSHITELCSYLIVCFYCTLGAFPVGSVIKYVGYLSRITGNIGNAFDIFIDLRENEPFLQVYLDYFDISNDMYQGSLAVEKRSDKKFDIEFKNVSFKYPGTDNYALKNIDLKFKVGERLAVVGMNGSGKTTFIKLLCRLYDPTEGEIFMNDFNIRKYDYREYLDIFSVVFQDFNLLALPLGNNVASSETWDADKAEQLLDEVGLGERYAQMPKKLDTPLYKEFDEDGVNVSGGEAQKIALARALYRDAPFIILDEPTAALDPIAEAEIYAKFNDIVGDKTAIYISHRLSSCRFCDKIAVFDGGEIVQIGTHEELLTDVNGKYYELWNAQAQYYTTSSHAHP